MSFSEVNRTEGRRVVVTKGLIRNRQTITALQNEAHIGAVLSDYRFEKVPYYNVVSMSRLVRYQLPVECELEH